jgi:hypothetical protein
MRPPGLERLRTPAFDETDRRVVARGVELPHTPDLSGYHVAIAQRTGLDQHVACAESKLIMVKCMSNATSALALVFSRGGCHHNS